MDDILCQDPFRDSFDKDNPAPVPQTRRRQRAGWKVKTPKKRSTLAAFLALNSIVSQCHQANAINTVSESKLSQHLRQY